MNQLATTATSTGNSGALPVLAAILHVEPGTDLRTYVDELCQIAADWSLGALQAACVDVHRLPDTAPALVGRYVFTVALQHRLHGRPAPSFESFCASGLSPF